MDPVFHSVQLSALTMLSSDSRLLTFKKWLSPSSLSKLCALPHQSFPLPQPNIISLPLPGLWTLEYKRELTTPLCIAAAHGHVLCVRHLLSRSADPDASPGGRGALHEACLGGHTACARLLLQHGAAPDLLNAEGLAPLHLCRTPASLG